MILKLLKASNQRLSICLMYVGDNGVNLGFDI
jgi:hypothetical protein